LCTRKPPSPVMVVWGPGRVDLHHLRGDPARDLPADAFDLRQRHRDDLLPHCGVAWRYAQLRLCAVTG
ncbi:MAG: hypothetical protein WAO41_03885, partial [Candidatus Nanopelagicales bacterium]